MAVPMTTTPFDSAAERFYDLVWPHADAVLRAARLICRNDAEADDLA